MCIRNVVRKSPFLPTGGGGGGGGGGVVGKSPTLSLGTAQPLQSSMLASLAASCQGHGVSVLLGPAGATAACLVLKDPIATRPREQERTSSTLSTISDFSFEMK